MKRNTGLPKIDFVLYLRKKGIFIKFCYKEIDKIPIFSPKKSNLGNIKVRKEPKLNLHMSTAHFYSSRVLQIKLYTKLEKCGT